ncbi:acyl-CoA synthetase [Qingshengfaniella alkalisoli]|uniref:Acyl-CoA synthetase n=1 Tax=Qingshengfaniella alkalisoli TaxID=2599296 RepID=A0A5B8I9S5_9RHOB|nr:acyl-CoA synthetase [Qingshengfaniella alkalisoli]QDY69816.1 acyl-CoA synthetase [Qingshengfaniella alkalisoli]
MVAFTSVDVRNQVEAEMPWSERDIPLTVYDAILRTAQTHPDNNAISFQLLSDPDAKAETLTWKDLLGRVTQTANLFHSLGVGETDVVAMLLPNANETAMTLLGGMTAGITNPINPLLDVEQIAGILNETKAKVLVTLKSFPKTDVAQKAAQAAAFAPNVKAILEIDLLRYLTPPKSWIVPLIRPKVDARHSARVLNFVDEINKQPADKLIFEQSKEDRVAAYFHTGGTTGTPKVAQHKFSGMIYNGWLGQELLFEADDVMICPLPLFHVFATYPIMMSAIESGAHVVFPTPAGYRGDGVFDNFWKLIERWNVTFLITVPTALAALMQRPVDADVSSLKTAISGSAAMPVELYKRFEKATGVQVAEGYGLTEATCLVSVNPIEGKKKVGSVGIPLPYTDVRILHCEPDGTVTYECETDEVGEICIANPGVFEGSTYTEEGKNLGLFADRIYLRTGDLGRLDEDSYLWITGRKKDLIIRGGHNIDPAEIEDALISHPAVAFVGAIGQPDAHSGELPCAYVELVDGAMTSPSELLDYCKSRIHERAAIPKHIEILDELPKTAVGKIFKPDLRKLAIKRVFTKVMESGGFPVEVVEVVDDKKRGLTMKLRRHGSLDEDKFTSTMGQFASQWDWAEDA